jgi:hypothetical protein
MGGLSGIGYGPKFLGPGLSFGSSKIAILARFWMVASVPRTSKEPNSGIGISLPSKLDSDTLDGHSSLGRDCFRG